MQSSIPLTVIGGYLGSGKTTLLNALLRQPHGKRFALLVNDFGSINIDAELIENQDGDTINLANGCICCSLALGFVVALNTVLAYQPQPDQVLIEASGVANPGKIANYGNTPGFTLQAILVVVDAETIRAKSRDKYVGNTVVQQLKEADLLILNKIDLVSPEQKQAVLIWLAEIAPQSRLVEAQFGVVPFQILLGIESGQGLVISENAHDDPVDDAAYRSLSYISHEPLNRPQFERFLAELPEYILRAKGILHLADQPDRQMVFQLVGRRWEIKPGQPWGDQPPQSRLVWIGLKDQFDAEALSARLVKWFPTSLFVNHPND
jgi:G3E family GTPase